MEILMTLSIGAAGGGLIALLFEHTYLYFKEKRVETAKKVVRFSNEERRITDSVFHYLGPGSSVELMRSELGPPTKKYEAEFGLFSGDFSEEAENQNVQTLHAYLYLFKNAQVKVLSRDNEAIDALTVIALDKDIAMDALPIMVECGAESPKEFFNVAKIDDSMIGAGTRVEHFPGCRDVFAAVRTFSGSLYRTYITYFCDFDEYESDSSLMENPSALVGSTISGVCLSSRPEYASYIYISEII